MTLDESGSCVLLQRRVSLAGGSVSIGATDWEGASQSLRSFRVHAFQLDRAEVTLARYLVCVSATHCPRLPAQTEPGRPVVNVSPTEAARFCTFEGGRLPSSAEWLFAAAGATGSHYAWGNTGLVCRRASFGMASGPCAEGATGPELAGARPDGASPDGILDLTGNVAEWTIEPDGSFVARGGSYRSELASELKTWAFEAAESAAPQVGFRCAYAASG
jgi:sulfatase modifying factor 1